MGICSYSKYSCERKVSQYEDNQKSLGLRYLFITDFKKQLLEKNNSRKPTKEKLMQIIRSLPGGQSLTIANYQRLDRLLSHNTFCEANRISMYKVLALGLLLMSGSALQKAFALADLFQENLVNECLDRAHMELVIQEELVIAQIYLPVLPWLDYFSQLSEEKLSDIRLWAEEIASQLYEGQPTIKVKDLLQKLRQEWSFLFRPDSLRRKYTSNWGDETFLLRILKKRAT